jgi:ketosteroid isomerase-like protein
MKPASPSTRLLVASLGIAGITACAALRPAAIVENFNRDATATAVRQSLERFHEALRQRQTSVILSFFLPDTDFRAFDGGEGWLTFDNLRLQDAADFRRLKSVEVHIDSLCISVLDPSAAVVADNLREIYTDSAGRQRRVRVTQTMVWTRRATGWKIAHLHSSERPDSTP